MDSHLASKYILTRVEYKEAIKAIIAKQEKHLKKKVGSKYV